MSISNKTKILLAICAVTVLVITVVLALLSTYKQIHNRGRIKAVGVEFYADILCTIRITEIEWGNVTPGSVHGVTLYAKNVNNTAVTLNLTVTNWDPASASQYLYSDWNYTGSVLQPSQIIPIRFQLTIYANVTGIDTFSFDYLVGVTEYIP